MIYILILVIIAALDILIKKQIDKKYEINSERYILRKTIKVTKHYNKGGFLNHFESHSGLLKLVSTVILVIVAIFFGFLLPKKGRKLKKTGLALIIGGALSNEYDRYTKGRVTDYFSINLPIIKRIVFNIGDIAIFVGVLFAFLSGSSHDDYSDNE